jgi:predicted RNA methylase
MKQWRRRALSAWRRHGPLRFFQLTVYNAWYEVRRTRRRATPDGDDFDAAHGTDTARVQEVSSLDIESPNARHAVRYEPSSAALVKQAIEWLSADLSDLTFIDFGSGKGRVVLLAAAYPFKAIVGVELSHELHEIATDNVRRAQLRPEDCAKISLVCHDATEFSLPDSDLVCYLYNPFGPAILAPLAERLLLHSARYGHRVFVIYVDPKHRDVFQKGGFSTIQDQPLVLVLRCDRGPTGDSH